MIEIIFHRLFSEKMVLHAKACDSSVPEDRFLIIYGNHEPRWIIPENPAYGLQVLKQWQPYGVLSRLKWEVLLFVYKAGMLRMMKGIDCVEIVGAGLQSWSDYGLDNKTTALPVIYVGTPGSTRKAVAVIVFEKMDNGPGIVIKAPLEENAVLSILNEASALSKLHEVKPGLAPELLVVNKRKGIVSQSIMEGRPSGRELTSAHVDWLLSLVMKERATLTHHVGVLIENIDSIASISSIDKEFILNAGNSLYDDCLLPVVWNHGDFVPWNIKINNNKLVVIDWEDGDEFGLPLQDLAHFYVMQDYLFGGDSKFFHEFGLNKKIKFYSKQIGLSADVVLKLLMFYLLNTWYKRTEIGDVAFANYLLRACQIMRDGWK